MSARYLTLDVIYPGEFYAVTYIGSVEQKQRLIKIIPEPLLGGQYACDRQGHIYHLVEGHWKTHISTTDGNGYYIITVSGYVFRAHRLIAQTYLPNPLNLPQVDHKNRVRHDNTLSNLRWVTSLQNNHNRSMFLVQDKSVPLKYLDTYRSCVRHIHGVIAEYYRLCPPEG